MDINFSGLLAVLTKVLQKSRYHEAWQGMFRQAAQYIKDLPPTQPIKQCHGDDQTTPSGKICATCRCGLFALLTELEALSSLQALESALKNPTTTYSSLSCCFQGSSPRPTCRHVTDLVKFCQERIRKMPTFASFLTVKN